MKPDIGSGIGSRGRWVALLVATAACGAGEAATSPGAAKKADPPAASLEKLEFGFADLRVTADKPSAVNIQGNNIWGGLYPVPGMQLTVEVKANTAATFTLGAATAELEAGKPARVTVDTTPYLRRVLADDDNKFDSGMFPYLPAGVEIPWSVSRAGKTELDEKLSLDPQALIRVWTETLSTTPMLLDGEAPTPPRGDSVLIVDEGAPILIGDAAAFREIDYVAFRESQYREMKCGPYVEEGGGSTKYIDFTFVDLNLRLHERRTGKSVATKLFRARGGCPAAITSAWTGDSASVSPDEIKRWVRSQLGG
jgi:hypothetical protein